MPQGIASCRVFHNALLFSLHLTVLMTLMLAIESRAQIIDPVTAAQAPIPGSGHHYIGMGAETVNPSDGSVSFDLPIQTPSGRGITLPFGIRYNEEAPFSISNGGAYPGFSWIVPNSNGMPTPFDVNGWSYRLPTYQAQGYVAYQQYETSGCSQFPNCPINYCFATQNYSFTGLDGVSHVLDLANDWADPNDPQIVIGGSICAGMGANGYGGYAGFPYDGISASMVGSTPLGSNSQPPITVTDPSGTVYSFAQVPWVSPNPTGQAVQPFGMLAQTITDRNGNQISLSSGSNPENVSATGPGSYIDTVGRTVLSWSGLGSSSGDTVSVSGLGKIGVQWTSTTVTFPTGYNQLSYPVSSSGQTCTLNNATSLSLSVAGEIDLPNGQKYTLGYGSAYSPNSQWGRLSKITFPDGGYVRYVWGTNAQSKAVYGQWVSLVPNVTATYDCWLVVDAPAITDRYVSYDGINEVLHQSFAYATNWTYQGGVQVPVWSSKVTTVTSTDSVASQTSVTRYTYIPVSPFVGPNDYLKLTYTEWQGQQIPVEQSVVYQDLSNAGGGGHTYKTVNKTWFDQYTMVADQSILDNGLGTTTVRCLDQFARTPLVSEYNFLNSGTATGLSYPSSCVGGPSMISGLSTSVVGPLLRQTVTAYHNFPTAWILDEPDSVTTLDGSGNVVSKTGFVYDGTPTVSSGTTVSPSPSVVSFVTPSGARGNATSVSHWLNTNNSSLTTNYTYFDTGQIQSMTDPLQNITSFSYADSFLSGTGSPQTTNAQTNAYLTKVTYPNTGVAHQESFTWGYNDGLLRSHTDQNSQTTSYEYNDLLLRLTKVQGPADPLNGNQSATTNYAYTDWMPGDTGAATSSIAKSEFESTSGAYMTSNSVLDGMGHATQTQVTSDASGTAYVNTVYDGLGRVHSVSNPYRSNLEGTYGLTTYTYDVMGRKTVQANPDGTSSKRWCYNGYAATGQTNCYTHGGSGHGTWVDEADENGNDWQRTTDALARLVTVLEPSSTSAAPSMETDYSYDLLNDLTLVTQTGGSGSAGSITRSFSYDSLSRLIQSFNPEAGWTCYGTTGGSAPNGSNCMSGYDADGNLRYKTDARNVVVTFSYDALNRVRSKSYSNDASLTPTSCYQYDASTFASSSPNLIGRLTNQWTQSASAGVCNAAPPTTGIWTRRSVVAYDVMGRVVSEQQCTPSNCTSGTPYKPAYTYDMAGITTSATNGIAATPGATSNPLKFTYLPDSVGRLQKVTSNWNDATHPTTLFTAQSVGQTTPCSNSLSYPYTAFGSLMNATFGGGLALNRAFDKRLRTTCEIDTGGALGLATSGSATLTITGAEQSK